MSQIDNATQTTDVKREYGTGVVTMSQKRPGASRQNPSLPADIFVAETGQTSAMAPMRLVRKSRRVGGIIDAALLRKTLELLEDIEHFEPDEAAVALESVRNVVFRLWVSAESATVYHRSVLANVENFLTSRDTLDANQASVVRGAIKALSMSGIGEEHAKVIRSGFIDYGQKPLSLLEGEELGS